MNALPPARILILGYGNPLRCDDGIAWQTSKALKRALGDSAKVICVHQLTPELAEDLSQAEIVIFLDASRSGQLGQVRCQAVLPQANGLRFSHHLSPAEVLALSDQLYTVRPRAFLISVHGQCFDHGQELSPAAIHAVPEVVAQVSKLIDHLSRASEATCSR